MRAVDPGLDPGNTYVKMYCIFVDTDLSVPRVTFRDSINQLNKILDFSLKIQKICKISFDASKTFTLLQNTSRHSFISHQNPFLHYNSSLSNHPTLKIHPQVSHYRFRAIHANRDTDATLFRGALSSCRRLVCLSGRFSRGLGKYKCKIARNLCHTASAATRPRVSKSCASRAEPPRRGLYIRLHNKTLVRARARLASFSPDIPLALLFFFFFFTALSGISSGEWCIIEAWRCSDVECLLECVLREGGARI